LKSLKANSIWREKRFSRGIVRRLLNYSKNIRRLKSNSWKIESKKKKNILKSLKILRLKIPMTKLSKRSSLKKRCKSFKSAWRT